MFRTFTAILTVLLLSGIALADHTSIIGGFRDGMALGMRVDYHLNDRFILHSGLEASTGEDFTADGDNPLVLFAGGRTPIGKFGWSPVFWGLEGVGNFGVNTELGFSTYLVWENLYQQEPLYLQAGLDNFSRHSHVIVQLGYTLF
jgi:hypothetical protein